jgi:hypothetical protein
MLMRKSMIVIAIGLLLLVVGLAWTGIQAASRMKVAITFMGFTNNPAGLLSTSDKILAVFSVTNYLESPIEDVGVYYIEASRSVSTYGPVGSPGVIAPHGSRTIVTRVPTNTGPWRLIIPYSRATHTGRMLGLIPGWLDGILGRPRFGYDRYGNGAPRSDWVQP